MAERKVGEYQDKHLKFSFRPLIGFGAHSLLSLISLFWVVPSLATNGACGEKIAQKAISIGLEDASPRARNQKFTQEIVSSLENAPDKRSAEFVAYQDQKVAIENLANIEVSTWLRTNDSQWMGIYKLLRPRRGLGDTLETINFGKGDEAPVKKTLKTYPNNTTVDSFMPTPDGKKLVVLYYERQLKELEGQLVADSQDNISDLESPECVEKCYPTGDKQKPFSFYFEVIDLTSGSTIHSSKIATRTSRFGLKGKDESRSRAFEDPIVTNNYAIITTQTEALEAMDKVIWFDQPKVTEADLFVHEPYFNKAENLTISPDGRFVVTTANLKIENSSKRNRLDQYHGVFLRDLTKEAPKRKANPFFFKAKKNSLFNKENLLVSFEDLEIRGTNPVYVFSPDNRTLLILGNRSGAYIVKNLDQTPELQKIDHLHPNQMVKGATFSPDGRYFVLYGYIDAQTTWQTIKPDFAFAMETETLRPITSLPQIFDTQKFNVLKEVRYDTSGERIIGLFNNRRMIQIFDAKTFSGLRSMNLGQVLGAGEFITDFLFSSNPDDEVFYLATNWERVLPVTLPTRPESGPKVRAITLPPKE